MIRVILFDDNVHIRESVTLMLSYSIDLVLITAYENCYQLLKKIEHARPNVIIMDIDMPGMNGIEAVKIIKESNPDIQILMQTVFEDDDKIFRAISAGASGYLLKKDFSGKLIESIKDVYNGGSPLSPSVARKVVELFRKVVVPQKDNQYQLTAKEMETLAHLVDGKSYKEIALAMKNQYSTVHTHIKSIYRKIHVASMSEAVAKALREGLV